MHGRTGTVGVVGSRENSTLAPRRNPQSLIVVGASGRAMAQSARRAGIPAHAADLFRDTDLVESCVSSTLVAPYPDGIVDVLRMLPAAAWCHVGGLENRPDILEALAAERPLAGSSAASVRLVRDHHWLAARVREVGAAMPATHDTAVGIPCDGSHLVKPRAGAGGRGIRRWTGATAEDRGVVWQRWVDGMPCSAAYLASRGRTDLFLTSRQLVDWKPCRGSEFAWCGSITRRLPAAVTAVVERLGRHVAAEAGLIGLFGIDFLLDDGGRVHPLEVNPRPTASMELWERSGAGSLAASHLAACGFGDPTASPPSGIPSTVFGKAVLFAVRSAVVPAAAFERWLRWREDWRDGDGLPAVADIPATGTTIPRGGPVLTIFAAGNEEEDVLARLERRLALVEESLRPRSTTISPPSAAAGASPPRGRGTP